MTRRNVYSVITGTQDTKKKEKAGKIIFFLLLIPGRLLLYSKP